MLNTQDKKLLGAFIIDLLTPVELRAYLKLPLNRDFDNLTTSIVFEEQVEEIVERSVDQRWTGELIELLLQLNPAHQGLIELIAKAGAIRALSRDSFSNYQNYVKAGDMLPYTTYLERGLRISRVTCSIAVHGPKTELGTGFLVGPDLLMTNYHVADQLHERPDEVTHILLKFDYRDEGDAHELKYSVERLELVSYSEPAGNTIDDQDITAPWNPDLLDYALIRLPEAVGEKPYGSFIKNYAGKAPIRSWLPLRPPAQQLRNDPQRVVQIAQHPQGEQMKWAMGNVQALDAAKLRIRYTTNTDKGSSGAPVFNEALDLIAIHHRGNAGYQTNQGIPITAIIDHLQRNGITIPPPPAPDASVMVAGIQHRAEIDVVGLVEVLNRKPFIGREKMKNYFHRVLNGERLVSVLMLNGKSRVGRSYIYHFCDHLVAREYFKMVKVDFRGQGAIRAPMLARQIAILLELGGFHQTDQGFREEDFKQQIFLSQVEIFLRKNEQRHLFFFDHCQEAKLTDKAKNLIVGLANTISRESVPGIFLGVDIDNETQSRIHGLQPTIGNFDEEDVRNYFDRFYELLRLEHPHLTEEDKQNFIQLGLAKIPPTLLAPADNSICVEEVSRHAEIISQALRDQLSPNELAW